MLVKRVRIISADLSTYWYSDKIGQEFYVRGEPTDELRRYGPTVISVGHHFGRPDVLHINDTDIEVLETFEADIVEETIISIKRMNESEKRENTSKYKVVFEESHGDFEREVNEVMRDGWIPLGGVSVAAVGEWERPYVFAQAMTRNRIPSA